MDSPETFLKAGRCYRMRNGQVTPPLYKVNNGTNYCFEAKMQEPEYPEGDLSFLNWIPSGRKLCPGYDHPQDLIEESPPAPA